MHHNKPMVARMGAPEQHVTLWAVRMAYDRLAQYTSIQQSGASSYQVGKSHYYPWHSLSVQSSSSTLSSSRPGPPDFACWQPAPDPLYLEVAIVLCWGTCPKRSVSCPDGTKLHGYRQRMERLTQMAESKCSKWWVALSDTST